MTNLLYNNNNLLDHNLMSYGLVLGSLTILGFSIYYFTGNIFNQTVIKDVQNLPNAETVIQSVVNNLKAQPITSSDTVVPNLNNEVIQILTNKIDACVQTGSGVLNRVDIDVTRYTDQGLFIPWEGNLKSAMQELLYGMASDNQSITDISPTDFANHIRNNENY